MTVTLDAARKIADMAFQEGAKRGLTAMTVVVTDPGGVIRIAMRADAVGNFGVDIARAKCTTALGFNNASLKLAESFSNPIVAQGLTAATDGRFLPIGGGVPVRDADGCTIGAAAVAGGAPATDHEVIVAAVIGAGLTV
jgi:uncharacterized protein GlcG (DUF336 family)